MTRVGVNLLWLVPGDVGGSETWATGLLHHLAGHPPGPEVVVFASPALLAAHPWLDAFCVVRSPGGTSRPKRILAEATWLAWAARRARVDVLHHPGGTVPLLRWTPSVLTVHDLQPLAMPEYFSGRKLTYLSRRLEPSARAARITTGVSEFTRADVVARLGVADDRTAVTPPAVDPAPAASDVDVRAVLRLDRPWVVFPAITYPHKDHAVLVRALADLPDLLLVLTGGAGSQEEPLRRLAEQVGVADRVRRPGRVPAGVLDALYRGALACTFPSRYEAVGLPVLEAMARGCPVVAADATGLPAVVGDAGVLVAPGDITAWSEAIAALAADDARQAALRAAGHARVRAWAPAASAARLVDAWQRGASAGERGAV